MPTSPCHRNLFQTTIDRMASHRHQNISRNVNEKHFLYIPLRYELLFKTAEK